MRGGRGFNRAVDYDELDRGIRKEGSNCSVPGVVEESMVRMGRRFQLAHYLGRDNRRGGTQGIAVEDGGLIRGRKKGGVLWSYLEEQVILGKRLRVYEADGHKQHERCEIDQEPKAVGCFHRITPKSRIRRCYLPWFLLSNEVHSQAAQGESHAGCSEAIFRCSPIWAALILVQIAERAGVPLLAEGLLPS
jgi:hypothetical protein